MSTFLLLSLSLLAGSQECSPRWEREGLHICRSPQSTEGILEKIGSLSLEPALRFVWTDLVDTTQDFISAISVGDDEEGIQESHLFLGSQREALSLRFDPSLVRLVPRTGTLHLERLLPSTQATLPRTGTSRPRLPTKATWTRGRWTIPPSIRTGKGKEAVEARIGSALAQIPIEQARFNEGGWSLGMGPHLVHWRQSYSRIPDTLRGEAYLVPDSTVQEGQETQIRLKGKFTWHSRHARHGTLENDTLRADTGHTGNHVRFHEAVFLDGNGTVLSGTLLDPESINAPPLRIKLSRGTRFQEGAPVLDGPGTRHMLLARSCLEESCRFPDLFAGDSLVPLYAKSGTWEAHTQARITLRDGRYTRRGTLGLIAIKGIPGEPMQLKSILDSVELELAGLQDSSERPASQLGIVPRVALDHGWTGWMKAKDVLAPWRQWRDSTTLLTWRFRPVLTGSFALGHLLVDSLQASWDRGPFRPVPNPSSKKRELVDVMKPKACGLYQGISLPLPSLPLDTLYPGLGRFAPAETIHISCRESWIETTLRPAPAWLRSLGRDPIPARIRYAPLRDHLNSSHSAPRLCLELDPNQILSFAAPKPLAQGDRLNLCSTGERLVFEKDLSTHRFDSVQIIGTPLAPGLARLEKIRWTMHPDGRPDSLEERWQSISNRPEIVLKDGSTLAGKGPLRQILTSSPSGVVQRIEGKSLFHARANQVLTLHLENSASVDPHGRLIAPPRPETPPPPHGRAAIGLPNGDTLRIDRREVSNAEYDACVTAGKCPVRKQGCEPRRSSGSLSQDSARLNRLKGWSELSELPATCLEPEAARAYCRYAKGRLPRFTEIEGVMKKLYMPADNGSGAPPSLQWLDLRKGASPVASESNALGIYDIPGNVTEYCEPDPREIPVEWSFARFTCIMTDNNPPGFSRQKPHASWDIGFRCVEGESPVLDTPAHRSASAEPGPGPHSAPVHLD